MLECGLVCAIRRRQIAARGSRKVWIALVVDSQGAYCRMGIRKESGPRQRPVRLELENISPLAPARERARRHREIRGIRRAGHINAAILPHRHRVGRLVPASAKVSRVHDVAVCIQLGDEHVGRLHGHREQAAPRHHDLTNLGELPRQGRKRVEAVRAHQNAVGPCAHIQHRLARIGRENRRIRVQSSVRRLCPRHARVRTLKEAAVAARIQRAPMKWIGHDCNRLIGITG